MMNRTQNRFLPLTLTTLALMLLVCAFGATSAGAAATAPSQVVWAKPLNVTISGNTLKKTTGVAYKFDAGATSQQRMSTASGYAEVTADSIKDDVYTFFGLSARDNGAAYESIDFAIYMSGWTLKVYERGTDKGNFGAYKAGDVLRIAVESGRVNYYCNGVKFYTSTATPTLPLFVDASIADPGARIFNAMIGGSGWSSLTAATSTPATSAVGSAPPAISCQMFPADNIWNRDISTQPVNTRSTNYLAKIGNTTPLHPDFGSKLWQGETIGFFYSLVNRSTTMRQIIYNAYGSESDAGPFPIPTDARVQGGANATGDRHVIALDTEQCKLYELFKSYQQPNGSWAAKSGAVWDLKSNKLRPNGWTSADAAGFAVLPGAVRYEEITRGEINHAIRFVADMASINQGWVWPARHSDGTSTAADAPPMGSRLRLKSNYDISSFSPRLQVILKALKKYGMILADSGGPLNISGIVDPRWDDDELHDLERVKATAFEVVDESKLMVDINSGQSR